MKLITIKCPAQDGRPPIEVSGYRFQGRVGPYCHWFVVHESEARITHFASGLYVGPLANVNFTLGDRVAAARLSILDIAKGPAWKPLHDALQRAAPRPR